MVAVTLQAIEAQKQRRRIYYALNKARILAQRQEYALKHPEKVLEHRRNEYLRNRDRYLQRSRSYVGLIRDRTPLWADKEKIAEIYRLRPIGYHVDHIVPLQGEYVSGLHVEYNLQYLPATDNLKKGNKYG